jgi:hypothetical protein
MVFTTARNVVFYIKRSCEVVFFVATIWTLAPLYRRNFAEFRARLCVWIIAPVSAAIGWSYELASTALEWLVTKLLELRAVQRIVESSGIPEEYYQHVLPSAVMLVVTIYLGVRFVIWSRRVGEQKCDQVEAQCQVRIGAGEDEKKLSSGAISKD